MSSPNDLTVEQAQAVLRLGGAIKSTVHSAYHSTPFPVHISPRKDGFRVSYGPENRHQDFSFSSLPQLASFYAKYGMTLLDFEVSDEPTTNQ